jgi:hypothetical protein
MDYAADNEGRLPQKHERNEVARPYQQRSTHYALVCNKRAPYVWGEVSEIPETPVPLVWCGTAHGYRDRWRNVLYSDWSIRQVDEETARRWQP